MENGIPVYSEADGVIRYLTIRGKLHRLDGPARIYHTGYKDYWINGELIAENVSGSELDEFNDHPDVIQFKKEQLIKIWTEE